MHVGEEHPAAPDIAYPAFEAVDLRVARVLAAPLAEGTHRPSRVLTLDLGHLGIRTSVGQLALVPEGDLVGRLVVACVNLGERKIGAYRSQALTLGVPHPDSPADQFQALPLYVDGPGLPGDRVF